MYVSFCHSNACVLTPILSAAASPQACEHFKRLSTLSLASDTNHPSTDNDGDGEVEGRTQPHEEQEMAKAFSLPSREQSRVDNVAVRRDKREVRVLTTETVSNAVAKPQHIYALSQREDEFEHWLSQLTGEFQEQLSETELVRAASRRISNTSSHW